MKWMLFALLSASLALGVMQSGHAEQAAAAPAAVPPAAAPAVPAIPAAPAGPAVPAAPAAPATPAAPLSRDDIDAAILDRQLVMQALEKDVDKLGSIFAGVVPVTQLGATLESIAKLAKESQTSFVPVAPGGSSKPEVWGAGKAKFDEIMTQFVTKSEEMIKVGATGDLAAVGTASVDALPCKQCHDIYRLKK